MAPCGYETLLSCGGAICDGEATKGKPEKLMRTILIQASMFLSAAAVIALGADNTFGTYKLNVAKSSYVPPPNPNKDL